MTRGLWFVGMGIAGCGGIETAKEAPFALHPKSVLWSAVDSDNEAYGGAVLVFANEEVACSTFEGKTLEEWIQALIAQGDGLGFLIEAFADQGSVVGELTGLWNDFDSQAYEEPYAQLRDLVPFGWNEGFSFNLYGNSPAWLMLDEVGEKVTGEFDTVWWSGSFKAEACGSWNLEEAVPTDTGSSSSSTF